MATRMETCSSKIHPSNGISCGAIQARISLSHLASHFPLQKQKVMFKFRLHHSNCKYICPAIGDDGIGQSRRKQFIYI